jgi:tetratricopeptide (TPR) repeat protein
MRHGASHVAERALESALPAIVCEEHLEMMLLLAEALQEQGRWRESLDRLAAMPSSCAQDLRWRGIVLSAIAVVNMGASLVDDARSKIPTLMTILRESMDGRTRVTAARVLAHFASVYRDSEAATNVLTLVDGIRADALDEDAQGKLALTRGMLLWVSGDVAASYDQVSRTVDTLMQKRTQNIVTVQLIAGLGVLSTHQGEYEKARSHYVLALDMASRLGNDTQVASILANMAICHGRLGDYPEQLRLCLSAPRPWGAEFGGLIEVQLSYSQALALVMLGRPDDAIRTTAKLDERIQGEFPPWMLQAWLLWKADILLCAGRVSEALPVARRAVHHFGFELQTPAFAGPFARWIGHLGRSETDRSELVRSMVSLLARLGSYDAVDEVEVMCAGLSLDMVCGQQAEEYRETIQERLLALPAEVTSHLKRLGSLS